MPDFDPGMTPHPDMSDGKLPTHFPDRRPSSPETDKTPESAERIEATRAALEKLAQATQDYRHPHSRAQEGQELSEVTLRAFTDEGEDSAYRLSLGYPTETPDDKLMLSLETPINTGPWPEMAGESGAVVQRRKVQDFLYRKGSETVPVRDADFTYVFDYRPAGSTTYDAPAEQVDQVLQMLAQANVMRGSEKGPKVTELVPEIADLLKTA